MREVTGLIPVQLQEFPSEQIVRENIWFPEPKLLLSAPPVKLLLPAPRLAGFPCLMCIGFIIPESKILKPEQIRILLPEITNILLPKITTPTRIESHNILVELNRGSVPGKSKIQPVFESNSLLN